MDKLRMESVDMMAQNIDKIAALFPNCITETKDDSGRPKRAINFDLLRQMLSGDVIDGDEVYEFTWVGKKAAIMEANKPIRKTLRPCLEESVNWGSTENLYIEGDNLEVLKLLQESYLGKVKMIYIDPPYNTGSDSFFYRDSYAMSREDYDEEIGKFDENGNVVFMENSNSNPRFHSNWCSMIYQRLLIARNFLAEDGVIFISIDDNEVDSLKKICNEIFGESNFVGCAGRITKKANNQGDYWAPNFDYLLTYTKNRSACPAFFGGMNKKSYNLVEEDGPRKGERYQLVRLYMSNLDPMRGCANQRYYIECPDGTFIIPPGESYPDKLKDGAYVIPKSGKDKIWRWSYQSYLEKKDQIVLKKGRSSNVVGANGEKTQWNAFTKTYLTDVIEKSTATPNSFIEEHINQNATHELKKLGIPFSFAKPSSLMKYLAEICRVGDDDIVLDFFSGSASTADSVMQLQSDKGIKCHYIMVQLDEKCDEDSDAYKEGYPNICEIGKERIRRAAKKIAEEHPDAKFDGGFRVLKLDDTNMKDVYYAPVDYEQNVLDLLESNIKEDRSDLDLLFGCLLEWGLPLSLPYKSENIEGCTVHNYNDGDLIACFDENVPESVIKTIAEMQPLRAVFRDSSFASSPEKINVTEIFKRLAPDTSVKVL
ncbi:site-specific DNA-methyltransferase [Bifidobacterium dentium]|uniref:site-specific DNA-methyltransferase n=1 Tax=Bifidobacterium dentium TaxID=1689 RepID=UPI0022E928D6|nr:site-specific DNA-methyltransferase [Bifidobacterium dentium]